jgi:hypothetical protein
VNESAQLENQCYSLARWVCDTHEINESLERSLKNSGRFGEERGEAMPEQINVKIAKKKKIMVLVGMKCISGV